MANPTQFPMVGTREPARNTFAERVQVDKFQAVPTVLPTRLYNWRIQIENGNVLPQMTAWKERVQVDKFQAGATVLPSRFPTRQNQPSATIEPIIRVWIERVQLDKWYTLPPQQRPSGPGAVQYPQTNFAVTGQAAVFPDRYMVPDIFVRAPRFITQDLGVMAQLISWIERSQVDKWMEPFVIPSRSPNRPNQQESTSDEPTLNDRSFHRYPDAWQHEIQQPTRFGGKPGQSQSIIPQLLSWLERTQLDKWYVDTFMPRNGARITQDTQDDAVYNFGSVFSTFIDRYWTPFVEPSRRSKPNPQDTQDDSVYNALPFAFFGIPFVEPSRRTRINTQDTGAMPQMTPWAERVQLDKWWTSFVEPNRQPGRPGPQILVVHPQLISWIETAQMDKWWMPMAEPARQYGRPNQPASVAHLLRSLAEVITLDKWFYPLGEPTRFGQKPGQSASPLSQITSWIERAQLDKWATADVLPLFGSKPGIQPVQNVPIIVLNALVNLDKWCAFMAFPQNRTTQSTQDTSRPPQLINFKETAQLDKWFQPLTLPFGFVRAIPQTAQDTPNQAEQTMLDKWWLPQSEPARKNVPFSQVTMKDIQLVSWSNTAQVDKWYSAPTMPAPIRKQVIDAMPLVFKQAPAIYVPQNLMPDTWPRPLKRIDPNQYLFIDPITGWYKGHSQIVNLCFTINQKKGLVMFINRNQTFIASISRTHNLVAFINRSGKLVFIIDRNKGMTFNQ